MAVPRDSSKTKVKNLSIFVEKSMLIGRKAIDHVQRILGDHDYVKCMSVEGKKSGNIAHFVNKVDGATCRLNGQDLKDVVSGKPNMKPRKDEHVPNEGIQASDLSSLLEQFLEYEEAVTKTTSLLTPATSPGHCENWNEQVLVKDDTHPDTTELTPPGTPPIVETAESKPLILMDHTTSSEKKQESDKILCDKEHDTTSLRKRKIEESEENSISDPKRVKLPSPLHETTNKSSDQGKHVEDNKKINQEEEAKVIGCCEQKNELQPKVECCEQQNEQNTNLNNNVLKEKNESESGEAWCENEEDVNKTQHGVDEALCELKTGVEVEKTQSDNVKPQKKVEDDSKLVNCESMCKEKRRRGKRRNSRESDKSSDDDNEHELSRKSDREELSDDGEDREHDRRSKNYERYDHNSNREYSHSAKRHRRHSDDKTRHGSYDYDQRLDVSERHRHDDCEHHPRHDDSGRRRPDYCERHRRYADSERHDRRHRDHDRRRHDAERRKKVRDVEHERKIDFRLGRSFIKDSAKKERRVVYVGGLPYGTTRDELWNRLRRFGPVEEVTVHFREGDRDNYGFVTYFERDDARECIERGNSDRNEPFLDLCFGGRRQYCGGSYVDFDSKTSHIEELTEAYGNVRGEIPEEDDFDTLLRQCQENLGRDTSQCV